MANTQNHLVISWTLCLVIISLLKKVDSVSASGISLNGNDNTLRQHPDQPIDNNVEDPDYIMDPTKQRATTIVPNNSFDLEGYENDILTANSLNNDLTRSQLTFGHPYGPITIAKRAPGGFVGMRGKKLYFKDDDSESNDDNDNDNSITLPWNQIQISNEDTYWDEYAKSNGKRYKKTPTAFYGVRGKKFAITNGINPRNDNRRWQEFLEKVEKDRLRDNILEDFVQRLTDTDNDISNEMSKRAPTGFTGVRGKRPAIDENIETSMDTLTKRGLGNNAFVGVRGKKDVSHQTFKRSPMGAERYFFDFWKKSSPLGGGKRQRFVDFNNKFVAVRGKKSSYNGMESHNDINNNELQSLATMNLLYAKRTPNGFLGMRGKRPFPSDDVLSIN